MGDEITTSNLVDKMAAWIAVGDLLGRYFHLVLPHIALSNEELSTVGAICGAMVALLLWSRGRVTESRNVLGCLDRADSLFFGGQIDEYEYWAMRECCIRKC